MLRPLIISASSVVIFQTSLALGADLKMPTSCLTDTSVQSARQRELKQIYDEDQSDRAEIEAHLDRPAAVEKMFATASHDLEHRKRVAAIFAEGCLKSAADYSEAAMVYQHGTVPSHFFQTFLWAKEAVALGDISQKKVMAMGLDRYLMFSNRKQLFGTQAKKVNATDLCWCLWPMEKSFPAAKRSDYHGRSKMEGLVWVKEINGQNHCPAEECKVSADATPAGSVPGFW